MTEPVTANSWLVLVHQIPPSPGYLRSKIGTHLQRLGAVAIKNSVYALPQSEQGREDLAWVLREIVDGGGSGSVLEARLVDGLTDEQLRQSFRAARDADYGALAEDARALLARVRRGRAGSSECLDELAALQKRLAAVVGLDFFGAGGREPVEGILAAVAARLEPPRQAPRNEEAKMKRPNGATWVTRSGIHVDRMASAWLIRRFIDERARLRFVPAKEYRHRKGELRYDMFDGEFTHEGELCTFEVLLARFGIADPALRPIAEIVHDIDLKDDKYGRPEREGIARMVEAIAEAHDRDEARLERASALLDDLYSLFRRRRGRAS